MKLKGIGGKAAVLGVLIAAAAFFGVRYYQSKSPVPVPGVEIIKEKDISTVAAGEGGGSGSASGNSGAGASGSSSGSSGSVSSGSSGSASSGSSSAADTPTEADVNRIAVVPLPEGAFDLSAVPEYTDEDYYVVNENVPFFTASDLSALFAAADVDTSADYDAAAVAIGNAFGAVSSGRTASVLDTACGVGFSELDSLGRCGTAYACISPDMLTDAERGSIGMIKPSGWHTVKYDCVENKYLYNRCHLIAFMLCGINSDERNLITGTRYMNTTGMLHFEIKVGDYIEKTGYHVLYRVTPVFDGDDLVASGVLMEAESVEDRGEGLQFCAFVYNVQPQIAIDYATGDSSYIGD